MDGLENKAEGEMGKEAMGGMGGGSGGSGMDKEIDQGMIIARLTHTCPRPNVEC